VSGTASERLDAWVLTARARAAVGPDGRLSAGDVAGSEIFPFEGALLVKPLADPVLPEPPRGGEGPNPCEACPTTDSAYLWVSERWRLRPPREPQAVPTFLLEPRQHLDLGDLDDELAAELGVLTLRIQRAIRTIPGVGRVHVNIWGDGGKHLHVWFFARPAGMLQLRGSCLPDWIEVLPPIPAEEWSGFGRQVAGSLTGSDA